MTPARPVAVLFARADSNYRDIPGCDVWDIERDARRWPGGCPVVAHPPCRAWGRLRAFAKPRPDEKALAIFAVAQVRHWGGVLEHPAGSSLWAAAGLPRPGAGRDAFGGYTLSVQQFHWGHRARKQTWLYVITAPGGVPPVPHREGKPDRIIGASMFRAGHPKYKPEITQAEREHTPPALAGWLVSIARSAYLT